MNERVQEVIDGTLPPDALTPAEAGELDAAEEAVDRALAPVRAESAPDVTAAVMERVATLSAPRRDPIWSRLIGWIWTPRPVAFRPAWGLAAAALAAILLWAPGPGDSTGAEGTAPVAGTPGDHPVFVHFRLDAADARSVHLAGDFTGWAPRHALSESAPGVWTVVVPVEPGVHEYAFVVDGERWIADPLAPRLDDGFGGVNSRLDVVVPEVSQAPGRSL